MFYTQNAKVNVSGNASTQSDASNPYNSLYSVPSTITIVLLSLCASMITVTGSALFFCFHKLTSQRPLTLIPVRQPPGTYWSLLPSTFTATYEQSTTTSYSTWPLLIWLLAFTQWTSILFMSHKVRPTASHYYAEWPICDHWQMAQWNLLCYKIQFLSCMEWMNSCNTGALCIFFHQRSVY